MDGVGEDRGSDEADRRLLPLSEKIRLSLLAHGFDEIDDRHERSWLQERYDQIVSLVLDDALRSVQTGEPLSKDCRARLPQAAEDHRDDDVSLRVVLRGALLRRCTCS